MRTGNVGIASLLLNWALDGGDGQLHAPAALPPTEHPLGIKCVDPKAIWALGEEKYLLILLV
jgi:hypothetical protein